MEPIHFITGSIGILGGLATCYKCREVSVIKNGNFNLLRNTGYNKIGHKGYMLVKFKKNNYILPSYGIMYRNESEFSHIMVVGDTTIHIYKDVIRSYYCCTKFQIKNKDEVIHQYTFDDLDLSQDFNKFVEKAEKKKILSKEKERYDIRDDIYMDDNNKILYISINDYISSYIITRNIYICCFVLYMTTCYYLFYYPY